MKTADAPPLAKYLSRNCPMCAGYFGVIVSRLPYGSSIQAISGWCKRCNYRIAWSLLVSGNRRKQVPSWLKHRAASRLHPAWEKPQRSTDAAMTARKDKLF
jgi:hypothetical protein